MESQSSPLHAWNDVRKLLSTIIMQYNFAQQNDNVYTTLVSLIIISTHSSPTIEEFRDKDLGDKS